MATFPRFQFVKASLFSSLQPLIRFLTNFRTLVCLVSWKTLLWVARQLVLLDLFAYAKTILFFSKLAAIKSSVFISFSGWPLRLFEELIQKRVMFGHLDVYCMKCGVENALTRAEICSNWLSIFGTFGVNCFFTVHLPIHASL